jgi:carbon-monoxide dehydrogenase medium subunit
MKPAAFELCAASTVAEAIDFLAARTDAVKCLAGGQSLGPMLNMRLARVAALVDISRIDELRRVAADGSVTRIGAAVTHAEIEDGDAPDPTGGWLRAVASNIAHRAVRNRGTIGGSLAHADPAADWAIVMTGLFARAIITRAGREERIALDDFITGPFTTVLGEQDLLLCVEIDTPGRDARWGYWKFTRQVGEFAKASACVLVDPENGRTRCTIGALGRQPLVLPDSEAIVDGRITPAEALKAALPNRLEEDLILHVTALSRALDQARRTEATAP